MVLEMTTRSNKRMQLTKLRAAPERRDKVPPCARAARMDAGTASQLIRGVRAVRRPRSRWPGAHSQGESLDDLQRNLQEPVAMLLERA
jgi:hypothetical protein